MGGKPPILVVEDELDLRKLLAHRLKPYFDVVEADSVRAAIGALKDIPELRIVLSDNAIGRSGTGVDLHRAIKEVLVIRGGTMIVSTGGSYEVQKPYYDQEGIEVLHKPYSLKDDLLPRLARLASIEL